MKSQESEATKNISLKDYTFDALNGIPLSYALQAERDATIEDARIQNIPVINQTITQRTPAEVGSLIAFWQLYAVYSSVMRSRLDLALEAFESIFKDMCVEWIRSTNLK